MNNLTKTERNYGIDLLRMVSMFMVCVLHVLEQGGILHGAKMLSAQYETAWLLDIIAFCAVNCFALISGYVCINAKFKYSNGIVLWLKVLFYSILITALFAIFMPDTVGFAEWIKAVCPIMTYQYWYFTCYVVLFFLIPMINKGINAMTDKQLKVLAIALITLFCFLQIAFKGLFLDAYWQDDYGEVFTTAEGYSPIWIIVLYIIGACFKKTGTFEKISIKKGLIGFILMAAFTWAFKYVVQLKAAPMPRGDEKWELMWLSSRFANYISPTILFEAVFLVAIFEKLRLPKWLTSVVKFASPMAFSVYLIHVHQLVWNNILPDRFENFASLSAPLLALAVLGTSLAIYVGCTLLDIVRELLFKALKVKQRAAAFENKHFPALGE